MLPSPVFSKKPKYLYFDIDGTWLDYDDQPKPALLGSRLQTALKNARFDRMFWKYRRHAKAWRAVHLDAGHLSQTMYLSATELGLGCFVTAAINDREVGEALGLPPLCEGAIALVGFGPRSDQKTYRELDVLDPVEPLRAANP